MGENTLKNTGFLTFLLHFLNEGVIAGQPAKGNSTGGEIQVEDFHLVIDEVTGIVEVMKGK